MKSSLMRISGGQLMWLLFTLVGATAILYAPAISMREAGQNAWLAVLVLPTIYGLLVVWVTTKLATRFHGFTFGQYTALILGRWFARIIGFLYWLFVLMLLILIVRQFGNFLSTAFMPETPLIVFNFSLVIIAAWAAVAGIEVVARMNQFVLPIVAVAVLFTAAALLKDMELARLLPILDQGLMPVLKASPVPSSFRGEVFILMWLALHVKKPEQSLKWGSWAVILLGIALALDATLTAAVMSQELAARAAFPIFLVARYVSISNMIDRTEGMIMVIWVATVVIKVAILIWIALEIGRETFSLQKSTGYLAIPIAIIVLVGARYTFNNDPQLAWFMKNIMPPFAFIFQLLLPGLMLFWAWLKKQEVRENG